ncbi:large conductance mechanosensitive channel protein MscL [Parasphingorhabdus sp. JC815]|uniref:large conductance mechanosensitive channel protein MscL n=1 Tax=Parasphingorhabdus sp. JC815 TaxID=3232140 RepID=UPI003458EA48
MFAEFKSFILKGNVLDLAVAVIIGAAFATITTSLTEDVIMPVVSAIMGAPDFSTQFILLGPPPAELAGSTDYAALKEAGVPMLGWGQFLTVVINFVILAFIIFLIVRYANKIITKKEAAAGPKEIDLLVEIRDLLKDKR